MIEIKNISKTFDDFRAVDNISFEIKEDSVFGLIGTNGAGKSTVLRMIAGVLKPDLGTITIDSEPVYDNIKAKRNFFFIADEPYFFANANANDMAVFYRRIYKDFDRQMFDEYLKNFALESRRKINTYSKGMKKQLALLLGICSNTKYLFCDETFDGLDPVMRQSIKSIFASEMDKRGLTPVIASHNLRELEDICDHIGLLHKGGVILSKDLEDLKCGIQKVQCVFTDDEAKKSTEEKINIATSENRGSLCTYTVRGTREEVTAVFENSRTVFYEVLPLSLEEIFISETEVAGYDVKKLILG